MKTLLRIGNHPRLFKILNLFINVHDDIAIYVNVYNSALETIGIKLNH